MVINFIIILISGEIQAKYLLEYEFDIANLNIDRTKPKIELLEITNSSAKNKEIANKDDIVKVKIKITDKNLKDIFLNEEYLNVNVDDEIVKDSSIKIYKLENISDGEIYQIELKKIEGNGFLKLNM